MSRAFSMQCTAFSLLLQILGANHRKWGKSPNLAPQNPEKNRRKVRALVSTQQFDPLAQPGGGPRIELL